MNESPLEQLDVFVPFSALNVTASDSATAAGGTAAANHWTPMSNTQILGAKITYVSRDAGYVSQIVVEQAQDNAGTGLKQVSSYTLTSSQVAVTGNTISVNVHAGELDSANGFTYLRVRIVQTSGTATNTFTMIYVKSRPRFNGAIWLNYTLKLPQDQLPDGSTD